MVKEISACEAGDNRKQLQGNDVLDMSYNECEQFLSQFNGCGKLTKPLDEVSARRVRKHLESRMEELTEAMLDAAEQS